MQLFTAGKEITLSSHVCSLRRFKDGKMYKKEFKQKKKHVPMMEKKFHTTTTLCKLMN